MACIVNERSTIIGSQWPRTISCVPSVTYLGHWEWYAPHTSVQVCLMWQSSMLLVCIFCRDEAVWQQPLLQSYSRAFCLAVTICCISKSREELMFADICQTQPLYDPDSLFWFSQQVSCDRISDQLLRQLYRLHNSLRLSNKARLAGL